MRKTFKILIALALSTIFFMGQVRAGQDLPPKPKQKPDSTEKKAKRPEPSEDSRFIDNGDGTVTDRKTNLMWAKADSMVTGGGMNWNESREYVSNLSLGGHNDWRMPTITELRSILDFKYSLRSYAMNAPIHLSPIFAEGGAIWLWSSVAGSYRRACVISFDLGKVYEYDRGGNAGACGVRAVRGRRR